MLQPPQFKRSLWKSMQEPLQSDNPGLHDASHWPMLQTEGPLQTVPQLPQLFPSCSRSTQEPEGQTVYPGRHSHPPSMQMASSVHELSQFPQKFMSVNGSTQALPQ
jgi:hypothetical protein